MKAWTSLFRHIRVLNVALIAASSTVAFAQSGYDISFGSVPAFFTGTGNTLNLHVQTYSPNRINRIEVSIGGVEVFDEQWSWNDNKVHRPVDVDWSSEYLSHGTNVAFTAVVTLWTSSTTTQVLNFSTTAKPVYNKYAMVADTSLPLSASAAPTIASFLSNLDYAEEGYLVDDDWDADDFLGTGNGIGNATVIHVTCHGNTSGGDGLLAPPAGSTSIWAQDIEDAVLCGATQQSATAELRIHWIMLHDVGRWFRRVVLRGCQWHAKQGDDRVQADSLRFRRRGLYRRPVRSAKERQGARECRRSSISER